jgi:MFS family permease
VVVILFLTWVVSYMDRMVMSVAIPYIAKDFNLSPVAMGGVMSAFFAGYALCQIPGGLLADRFGARRLMVTALVWWSAFTAITGAVGSLTSMLVVRVFFGIGEGLFPGGSFKDGGAIAAFHLALPDLKAAAIRRHVNGDVPNTGAIRIVGSATIAQCSSTVRKRKQKRTMRRLRSARWKKH